MLNVSLQNMHPLKLNLNLFLSETKSLRNVFETVQHFIKQKDHLGLTLIPNKQQNACMTQPLLKCRSRIGYCIMLL